jgi:hypothetical protein
MAITKEKKKTRMRMREERRGRAKENWAAGHSPRICDEF